MKRPMHLYLVTCATSALVLLAAVPAWAAPPNDDFATAIAIPAVPATQSGDTTDATLQQDEPVPCGGIDRTVWYTITPSQDGVLAIDTFGSAFDTVLAAYTGSSVGSLTTLDCNDDAGGLQSRLTTPVIGGTTYAIQVGGFVGEAGALTLNVDTFEPPPGDFFSQATPIVGIPFEHSELTVGATVEPGEPNACGAIGSTIWYRYEAVEAGAVSVTSGGSGFDTVLAVYSGTSIGGLSLIDCNDDAGVYPFHPQSMVGFSAVPGTTYYIQAGGYGGAQGALNVRVSSGAHLGLLVGSIGVQADGEYQEIEVATSGIAGASLRVRDGSPEEMQACALTLVGGICAP